MPRRRTERKVGGYCKIRKRGCSSSTSSSSLVKNYRLKRAILVGKRAGSSTPVPTWKMALRSPSLAKQCHGVDCKGRETKTTSARRLAASLWEINGSQSPAACDNDQGEVDDFDGDQLDRCRKSLNLSHSPVSKNKDGSKKAGHRRKSSAISQKLQLIEYIGGGGIDSVTNGASVEVGSHRRRLKEVSYSLAASKEIVKVLFRLWSQEEQNLSRLTLVSALRVEIDRARHQVDELVHEQRDGSSKKDVVENLLRQFAAEKAVWKSREEDRVFEAVASMARELEIEKKLRRQSERLNKRLGRELADTRAQLAKAVKGLECERRARGILEQTCDELARGLGEDRAALEKFKRESEKVREEVERERQMLQLADVLREERVQMKLSEARYEFEEKNAALEMLRTELETYLGGKDSNDHANGDNQEFVEFLEKIQFESCQNGVRDEVEEESMDSELHSIELSMDNLNKSYKWSFAREQEQAESRRPSVEEVFKGRRSLSEQVQWENICLQRKTSDGIEWDFTINSTRKQSNANGFDKGRLSGASSQGERSDQKLIKGCKDMSAGSRRVRSCTSSRPESPLGKAPQTNSKKLITLLAMEAGEAKDNFGARSSTKAE